jgi:hypothetical protein
MPTRSKFLVFLDWLASAIAVPYGGWMAYSMADEFPKPSSWTFFLGLVAGTSVAVVGVVQFQRLNPLSNSDVSDAVEPTNIGRAARFGFRAGGVIFLAAALGASVVWILSPEPNWSWQLFLAFGLGLLAGAAANDRLDKGIGGR